MDRSEPAREPASFRDPSGFIFYRKSIPYRQVNRSYSAHYRCFVDSGLCRFLHDKGWLVPHEDVGAAPAATDRALTVLKPAGLPFISYPYEWCFGQLRDAALLTLRIQQAAFKHGMVLKDATPYNIQWYEGRPVLIDTLSFEVYREGDFWKPYRQFCEQFLAPLALMAFSSIELNRMLAMYIDGIPLELAARLLPWRACLRPSILTHIVLHSRSQQRWADRPAGVRGKTRMSRLAYQGLIDSLQGTVSRLSWDPHETTWAEYYEDTNYTPESLKAKREHAAAFIRRVKPSTTWDLGANTGVFSRLAAESGSFTVACDLDAGSVEKCYRQCRADGVRNLMPLRIDLTNPSPGIGWRNAERRAFIERGPVDLVMALALIHHLAIGNNVPLDDIADFFSRLGRFLIVEFVPKEDSQVQRLLRTREDIYEHYTRSEFERSFDRHFEILEQQEIAGSARLLYLMRAKSGGPA